MPVSPRTPSELPLPRPSANWALFLDVDGTLVDIATHPDAIVVDDRLPPLLSRLQRCLGGALAVVSGRRIDDIDRLLAPCALPAAGLHGMEWRNALGHRKQVDLPPAMLDAARERLARFAAANPGVAIEDKGAALAVHFRRAPDRVGAVQAIVAEITAAMRDHFSVQPGKMVMELRPRGPDKGDAVGAFMSEAPFRGRIPVYVGDDLTDEDGFAAAHRLGGLSIRIGGDAPSAARWRLDTVDALRDWLAEVADALCGSSVAEGEDRG